MDAIKAAYANIPLDTWFTYGATVETLLEDLLHEYGDDKYQNGKDMCISRVPFMGPLTCQTCGRQACLRKKRCAWAFNGHSKLSFIEAPPM